MAETDAQLARRIADVAGELLLTLRRSGLFEGKSLGKAGDRVANAFIMEALRQQRPDDGILSEEEAADPARLAKSRVWIVDPLDGTREYGEEGRTDWAVHIALSIDGKPEIGAVALPGIPLTLSSDKPTAIVPPGKSPLRMLVSRTRPAREAVEVAKLLGAELVPMGSAGAKAMAVVRNEADIYLHSGGQYEWDSCAPVAVARASGLHVSRIDGSPLVYNCENPYLPDLLMCRQEHAASVLGLIKKVNAEAVG
ncbi:MAG: 3'(2'),5'-bisphosphate nucleotidase CysQ [Rhodospirillaceae bacterium]|nr:MAG: 3'(2'),5'-bisphosphate nucleotidase CysQ [Rhodospirillaceae bacterium]